MNYFGDEKGAVKLAVQKMHEHKTNRKDKPSEMCPGTTIHLLVDEIKKKINVKEE